MTNEQQVATLKRGVEQWNQWRKDNFEVVPALDGADLQGADLSGADLSRAWLHNADLSRTDLSRTDLSGALLGWADLSEADLTDANLTGADLSGTCLLGANFRGAKLTGAYLSWESITEAFLYEEDLQGAILLDAGVEFEFAGAKDASDMDKVPVKRERVDVTLGASAPAVASPGGEFTARFVAYVPTLREDALKALRAGSSRAVAYPELELARWKPGLYVQVCARGNHLEIEPAIQRFRWNGALETLNFDVAVSRAAPQTTVVLRYDVLVAGARVAALRHDLDIRPEASDPGIKETWARAARSAFASYASWDRQAVLHRIAALKIGAGLDVFQDCLSLRPGEEWKPRLQREILDRDLFLLFWSRRAAMSEWVTWEWTTALEQKGDRAFQVHPLEPPNPALIPERLSHLHFGDPLMSIRAYDENASKKDA